MSLILVVEPEGRYVERIRDALTSEGWRTRTVGERAEALRAAASEAPNLVLVSAGVDGASALIDAFARRNGGPGVVAVIEEAAAGGASAEGLGADEMLTKPFTDQDLRLTVRRGLAAASRPAAQRSVVGDGKLTSADIFGDVVAEVEGELARAEEEAALDGERAGGLGFGGAPTIPVPVVHEPPGGAAEALPAEVAPQAPPAEQPPPTPAAGDGGPTPARRRRDDDDEIERRLEQTLSGVLGAERKAAAPPRGAPPPAAPPPTAKPVRQRPGGGDEIDALLSDTLGGLELDRKRRKPPAPPPQVEEDPLAGLDLSGLEELARPRRAAAATPEPPPPEPPAPEPAFEPFAAEPSVGEAPAAMPGDAFEAPASGGFEFDLGPAAAEPEPPPPAPASEPSSAEPPAAELPEPEPPEAPAPPVEVEEPEAAEAEPAAARGEGERFGQYTLLERIAVGGMAEVWKARMRGVEGFQKTVAIKKILPHLTDNAEFVSMFIDEAKLAAQLSHPNIIHIYDLGKIGDSYYIAMEYVAGQNLRTILDTARKEEWPMRHGLGLLIAARLASALDYAHRKRDFDNRELGLVHRDVSPQNVLISDDGDIKLCDFGIAKAVAKASHTQMGALKGKLQYMSPEQAWGRTVDARSDIFSLGSLLFEMLTGRRLFSGDSEISVLEAVRECEVDEPRSLDPAIPEGANEIVMKALAKEPDDRFESAGDLQSALERLIYTLKPTPGPADLAAYLEELAGTRPPQPVPEAPPTEPPTAEPEAVSAAEAAEPEAEEPEEPEPAADAPPPEVEEPEEAEPAATAGETTGTGVREREPAAAAAAAPGGATGSQVVAPIAGRAAADEGGRTGRWLLIAAIVIALALGVVAFLVLRPHGGPGPPEPPIEAPPPLLEDQPAAGEEAAPDAGGEGTGGEAGAAGDESGGAAADAAERGAADPAELEELVQERMAEREAAIRRQREEELRQLEQELEETRREGRTPAGAPDAGSAEETTEPPAAAGRAAGEPSPATTAAAQEPPGGLPPAGGAPAAGPPGPAAGTEPAEAAEETARAAAQQPPEPVPEPASPAAAPAQTSPQSPPATVRREPEPQPVRRGPESSRRREPEPAPAVRVGDLVEPGPGVIPPKLVSINKPEYPPIARRMRVEGDVVLSLLVDENGRVIDVRFVERVRQAVGMNEAAESAARRARYDPATKEGVRVKMWTILRVPFRL